MLLLSRLNNNSAVLNVNKPIIVMLYFSILLCYVGTCHLEMAHPQPPDMEVTVSTLNKQLRTADSWWCKFGEGLTTPQH
jgi:hypothetical protein